MADLKIPGHVARCPYCHGATLWAEFDEWDAETRAPTEAGTHVSCEVEEVSGIDHYAMPYVYWLPVQVKVHAWLIATGYTLPEDPAETLEKLRAWSAGEAIRS